VSTRTVDFVVRVDKKMWVGFGVFENCNSFFGTHGTVFAGKCFDCTDGAALSDDDAICSSTLVDWEMMCILGCNMFSIKSDFLLSLTSFWTLSQCCHILALNLC